MKENVGLKASEFDREDIKIIKNVFYKLLNDMPFDSLHSMFSNLTINKMYDIIDKIVLDDFCYSHDITLNDFYDKQSFWNHVRYCEIYEE